MDHLLDPHLPAEPALVRRAGGTLEGWDGPVMLTAELSYYRESPHAIYAHLIPSGHSRAESPIWIFSREVMRDAVRGQSAGADAVVMIPTTYHVDIHLCGEGWETRTIRLSRLTVMHFVMATYKIVPEGEETRHLDIDGALARILGGV